MMTFTIKFNYYATFKSELTPSSTKKNEFLYSSFVKTEVRVHTKL